MKECVPWGKRWELIAAFLFSWFLSGQAAAGVIAGAFGSHGLRKREGITSDKIHAWETASHYAVSITPGECFSLLAGRHVGRLHLTDAGTRFSMGWPCSLSLSTRGMRCTSSLAQRLLLGACCSLAAL